MRRLLDLAKSFLSRVTETARKHAPVFALSLLVLGGVFFFGPSVLAAEGSTTSGKIANFLAEAISVIFTLVGWLASKVLIGAVIPILVKAMSFNNFINAAPVVAGWVVVRDFTNLLFIIVLLVIAFGIIFSYDKYGRIDMIPQLFIMAIAINFSRTIVGFLTDISMVFMLTFVRAFEAAAAGNFVALFSVDVSKSLNSDSISQVADAASAIAIANIVSALMLVVTTIILGYLAVIMMIRIVVIWILIVIAPLAWFSKIIESWGVHAWDEWWKELKSQLVVGPIMAFFIWLALATASGASADFVNNIGPDGTRMDGSADIGFLDGATAASLVKAIIATAILLKGLEIAQHAGGVGTSLLGGAKAKARGVAGGLLGAGTLGFGSAATRAGLRGVSSFAEQRFGKESWVAREAGRYGKAQSLTGIALADVGRSVQQRGGGLVAGAQRVTGGYVPGLAALQRGVSAGGQAIAARGAAMTEAEEKAMKAQIGAGTPETTALQLKQLMGMSKNTRSEAQKLQLKELVKAAESNPKVWKELSDGDVQQLFKAREEITEDIKDATQRREAGHHDEEFMAKNLHRLPATPTIPQFNDDGSALLDAKGNPVLFSEQQAALAHLPSEFKGKVSLETITPDVKKLENGGAEADAENERVRANIAVLGQDSDALSRMITKNEDAMQSFMRNGSDEVKSRIAKTGKIKEEHLTEGIIKDPGVSSAAIATVISNMPPTGRADIRDNAPKREAMRQRLSEWNSTTPEASPDTKNQSRQNIVANLELHMANVAAAAAATPPGGTPAPVSMKSTLGIDGSSFTSPEAKANLRQVLTDNAMGADLLLSVNPDDMKDDLGAELGDKLAIGAVNEIERRIFEGKLKRDEKVEKLYAKLLTLQDAGGKLKLAENMKRSRSIEPNLNLPPDQRPPQVT